MAFCTCSSTLNNTGKTSKQTSVAAGKVLYAVQLKADDGTVNEIPSDVDFTQEYLDAKINETDETKRWFPIGTFVNNEDTRGDVITESFSDVGIKCNLDSAFLIINPDFKGLCAG